MVRAMKNSLEHSEFLLCSFEQELRASLICPEKTRIQVHLPQ